MAAFQRLVRMVTRTFYGNAVPPQQELSSETDKKRQEKSSNKGAAVVIVDALTRRKWTKEDDLAADLHIAPKQLRRVLQYLEEDQLVLRGAVKETSKDAKAVMAAIGRSFDSAEPLGTRTYSYVCLDYVRFFDVTRLRLHSLRARLKSEAEDIKLVQEYVCRTPACNNRRYTSLDAMSIFDPASGEFRCEDCKAALAHDLGGGEAGSDEVRRKRREEAKVLLGLYSAQIKPLEEQIARCLESGGEPPDYGTLLEWVSRRAAAARDVAKAIKEGGGAAGAHGAFGMYLPGDEEISVHLDGGGGARGGAAGGSGAGAAGGGGSRGVAGRLPAGKAKKVIPPWMIREGAAPQQQQDAQGAAGDDAYSAEYAKQFQAYLQEMAKQQRQEERKQEDADIAAEAVAAATAAATAAGGGAKKEEPGGGWGQITGVKRPREEDGVSADLFQMDEVSVQLAPGLRSAAADEAAPLPPAVGGAAAGEEAAGDDEEWEDVV